jgi:hypothetical protein
MFLLLLYSILSIEEVTIENNKWSNLEYSSNKLEENYDSKFIILTLETLEDLDDKKLELGD